MTLLPNPFYIPAVLGPEQKTLAGSPPPRIFALQMLLQQTLPWPLCTQAVPLWKRRWGWGEWGAGPAW